MKSYVLKGFERRWFWLENCKRVWIRIFDRKIYFFFSVFSVYKIIIGGVLFFTQIMNRIKEAVILIPGMDGKSKNASLNRLERAFFQHPDHQESTKHGGLPQKLGGSSLIFKRGKALSEIHLFELFWGDLRTDLTKEPIRNQIFKGIHLLNESRKMLKFSGQPRGLRLCGFVTSLGLLVWWLGLLIMAFNFIPLVTDGKSFADVVASDDSSLLSKFWSSIVCLVNWRLGVFLIIITLCFKKVIEMGVNIIHFTLRYDSEIHLQNEIWQRFALLFDQVNADESYSRITVLSHSFGTVIHANWLKDFTGESSRIRHITMGSPLAIMALHSENIRKMLAGALEKAKKKQSSWIDYFSDHDWMCSAVPHSLESFGMKSIEATQFEIQGTKLELGGRETFRLRWADNHLKYLQDESILEVLLPEI